MACRIRRAVYGAGRAWLLLSAITRRWSVLDRHEGRQVQGLGIAEAYRVRQGRVTASGGTA